MTLLDLIKDLAKLGHGLTIYVKELWQPASEAVAALPNPDEQPVPPELGLRPFAISWKSASQPPSSRALCERLIRYAINDA
jgi:DNA-binding transcriptional LysR family regulator